MNCISVMQSSFADFAPGKYALTLFFAGCNMRCWYCYNKEIVNNVPTQSLGDAQSQLDRLDAAFGGNPVPVVFSGGEPTASPAFGDALSRFEGRSLAIHTNGLLLPCGEGNPFQSVVLSLKTHHEAQMPRDEYVHRLQRAMSVYATALHREIRIVDTSTEREEHKSIVGELEGAIADAKWNVQWVEPLGINDKEV